MRPETILALKTGPGWAHPSRDQWGSGPPARRTVQPCIYAGAIVEPDCKPSSLVTTTQLPAVVIWPT
ncbi:hypothetical protein SAMN04488107_0054 [Geodermatophilus saharensis]|uniref:Uncharacterized protein n=1 Tax=Geodermatophilus saharensis TaxID=1137994 RepID=A0A238ZGH4_9ACTN|nr:hypothetical protein SAMN04488107_0054 [Geodermatophilus saharensis]